MKKRILSLLLISVLLLALLTFGAGAADYHVYDLPDLLTVEEWEGLEITARDTTDQFGCGVYIVVVEDYREYGGSVYEAVKNIYEANAFGEGSDRSGVMLFLSMDDRDYYILTHGYGTTAFTAYGTSLLEDEFLDDFRHNDWYSGFSDYLDTCYYILDCAAQGNILDSTDPRYQEGYYREETGGPDVGLIILSYVIGLVAAGIFAGINFSKLKSARLATEAEEYVVPHSQNVYRSMDIFTHITRTRTRIQSRSSSGGGHSGGGYGGRGGKF